MTTKPDEITKATFAQMVIVQVVLSATIESKGKMQIIQPTVKFKNMFTQKQKQGKYHELEKPYGDKLTPSKAHKRLKSAI